MMERPNNHLANTTVIMTAGKNHQWILKSMSENIMRKRIADSFKVFSDKILISKLKIL